MSRRAMALAGALFGVACAVGMALRGDVVPGIVTGVVGALFLYLVLLRMQERNEAVRRRRERRGAESAER